MDANHTEEPAMQTAHKITSLNTNADPACWGWYQARCSCGWSTIEHGHADAVAAAEAHVKAKA